ncbi:MAG: hypothetical protein LBG80_18155 [Bacteroidales bacterium]|jgi:hypothetical protein|nr:hypothetical protein [Bacteroidales bacterium]
MSYIHELNKKVENIEKLEERLNRKLEIRAKETIEEVIKKQKYDEYIKRLIHGG